MDSTINAPYATFTAAGTMDYTFSFHHSIEQISPLLWNAHIPADNLLMQYDYLHLIETSQKENMGFRYVMAKQEESIVGVLYFQVVNFTGSDLLNYFPTDATGWKKYFYAALKVICRPVFSIINAKILVSGNIFMTGESGFYFHPGIDENTRADLLRKAIDGIAANNKKIKAVVLSDLYEPKTDFHSNFQQNGFHEMKLEPDMSVQIREEWKSFDDYLNSFSSKYRVRTKKVFAVNNENHIERRELSVEEVEKHQDRLYELYLKVMEKADFKLGIFTKHYFRLQKQQLPNNYRIFAYFRGEELLSFISVFCLSNEVDVHYVGLESELNKSLHIYQRMMYDTIDIGIRYRAQRLHLGRTATEIKSTVGATPFPTFGYIKHVNSILNFLLIKPFTAYLKPKEYVIRNPFKS